MLELKHEYVMLASTDLIYLDKCGWNLEPRMMKIHRQLHVLAVYSFTNWNDFLHCLFPYPHYMYDNCI